jgi:hypothetical protein
MDPSQPVTLRLDGHVVPVLELTHREVVAELPDGCSGPWSHAFLEAEGARIELELAAEERSAGGHVLRVHDPDAQARLWALVDLLRTRREQDGSPAPHPGVVPERGHYTESARQARLVWLREHSGAALEALGQTSLDARTLTGNVENLVGTVEVPVGLAGPLLFDGEHARGHVVAPLATTEGALVASVSRGATAITRSGGVQTRVLHQQMVRAPIFELGDVQEAGRFVRWLEDHLEAIRGQVAMVSNHARLLRVEPWQAGRRVHVRFCYATGDAAGQNMTTACTWRACQWINDAVTRVPGIDLAFSAIEGNASGDKKVTSANHLGGRGTRVTAECWIDPATMEEVLKTTPERMMHGHAIGTSGGLQSGILGYSINASNLIAAMFLATARTSRACMSPVPRCSRSRRPGTGSARRCCCRASSSGPSAAAPRCRPSTTRSRRWAAPAGRLEKLAETRVRLRARVDLSTQAAVQAAVRRRDERRAQRPVRWLRAEDLDGELPGRCSASRSRRSSRSTSSGRAFYRADRARPRRPEASRVLPLRVHCPDRTLDVVVKAKPLDTEVILGRQGRVAVRRRAGPPVRALPRAAASRTAHARARRLPDPRAGWRVR